MSGGQTGRLPYGARTATSGLDEVDSFFAEEIYQSRSREILSGTNGGPAHAFHDFVQTNLSAAWAVSAGVAQDATVGNGVVTFPATDVTFISGLQMIANPAATRWHLGGRLRFHLAPTAGQNTGIWLNGASGAFSNDIYAGINQSVSAAKFVFTLSKAGVQTTALSTVNLDTTTYHRAEMWFDGVRVWGSVDNEAPVLVGVAANIPTVVLKKYAGSYVTNNGGATTMSLDDYYVAVDRV